MQDPEPVALVPSESKDDRERRLFTAFCDAIANRDSIAEACKTLGISWRWAWEYKAARIERHAEYQRARSYSGHAWADHSSKVAKDATVDTVQVAKLQEDNARWRASVANKKEFGHSMDVTSDGEQIRPAVVILPPLDPIPVQPGESVTITERQVTITGASAAEKLAAALAEYQASRHLLGPSEAP